MVPMHLNNLILYGHNTIFWRDSWQWQTDSKSYLLKADDYIKTLFTIKLYLMLHF